MTILDSSGNAVSEPKNVVADESGKDVDLNAEMQTIEAMERAGVDTTEKMMRLARLLGPDYEKTVSPPGGVPNICPLLEERRLKYGIADCYFNYEASFDRIFVFQISRNESEKYENSLLYKPDIVQAREEEEAPRGIILSAGLGARDVLVSNGMDVGHIINFLRLSPMRMVVGMVKVMPLYVIMLRVGDISSGEDLGANMRSGKIAVRGYKNSHGAIVHKMVDPNSPDSVDLPVAPKLPWMTSDH